MDLFVPKLMLVLRGLTLYSGIQGGLRFVMNNYYDMTRNATANKGAHEFWRHRVRERVHDPGKQELLASWEKPHLFGGKRLSLEQDFYDHFHKLTLHLSNLIRRSC